MGLVVEANVDVEEFLGYPVALCPRLSDALSTDGVVLVPERFRHCGDEVDAFPTGTDELFSFLRDNAGTEVVIQICYDKYIEIELRSKSIKLGKIIIASILLPIVVNLLAEYIKSKYMMPSGVQKVQLEILVQEKGKTFKIKYDGPSESLKDVLNYSNAQVQSTKKNK